MGVSADGFINDREGGFAWSAPDEDLFGFHLARVRGLGCHLCGCKLYETMLVWETDRSLRDTELHSAFADVWCALPKVVFSRTLDSVQGNARLAKGSWRRGSPPRSPQLKRTSRSVAPDWLRRRSS
jgi:hypothetical protein